MVKGAKPAKIHALQEVETQSEDGTRSMFLKARGINEGQWFACGRHLKHTYIREDYLMKKHQLQY